MELLVAKIIPILWSLNNYSKGGAKQIFIWIKYCVNNLRNKDSQLHSLRNSTILDFLFYELE